MVLGHIDAGINCYNDRQLEQGEGLQGYESAIEEIHIPRKISKSYRRDLQSHGPFPRHLTSENKTMASVSVKGEASTGTADTTSGHHQSPREITSGDEISHGGTRSKRSANERPSRPQAQDRSHAGDEWQDPNGPAHRAIACLLEKRSDDGVPEVQLRVVRV